MESSMYIYVRGSWQCPTTLCLSLITSLAVIVVIGGMHFRVDKLHMALFWPLDQTSKIVASNFENP
jgi:hypothetical protein